MKLLTVEEVNAITDYTYIKFVKVSHQYRFVINAGYGTDHVNMVDKDELNYVQGAGTLLISGNNWKIVDYVSTTLRLAGCKQYSTEQIIIDELEKMIKKEYDGCLM